MTFLPENATEPWMFFYIKVTSSNDSQWTQATAFDNLRLIYVYFTLDTLLLYPRIVELFLEIIPTCFISNFCILIIWSGHTLMKDINQNKETYEVLHVSVRPTINCTIWTLICMGMARYQVNSL